MPDAIDFYFDFSSPYAYLGSVMIEEVAKKHGRSVRWHSFMLGVAFKGEKTGPLTVYPRKGEYSRLDFDRTARKYKIPFNMPNDFPKATLAATIIIAVLSLVDLTILWRSWSYSRADFAAVSITILLTLMVGVEIGVATGVLVSLALFVWKTSRPHVAEVGQVPGSQHFRNIHRHKVVTDPAVVTLRIDESLYFANARQMEDLILARVHRNRTEIKHVILMCSAVNEIDRSALESLEAINQRLTDMGVKMHLSEVKGPVMDRLKCSHFLDELSGKVFLSQYEAFETLRRAENNKDSLAAE